MSVLLNKTKMLLAKRHCTIEEIAAATELNPNWVKKLASTKSIKQPNVVYVEKLYNFLSGKALVV